MTEWQDISTAPKDGTLVLGFEPAGDCGFVVIRWRDHLESDRTLCGDGYWEYVEELISSVSGEALPSHWQPLPEPPK